jgi:hypothetical protein
VAVLVVEPRPTTDGERAVAVEVVFVDLTNQPLARVSLASGPEADVAGPPGAVSLDFRVGKLVALVGRHAYVVPVPEEAAQGRALLRFAPDYPTAVVPDAGRSRFAAPTVAGAEGRAVISLHRGTEGLRYDATAGELVFEPEALVARVSTELAELAKRDSVDGYLKRTATAFEVLTGRRPRGVPVWVPFGMAAANNGRTAEARFGFFVEVPEVKIRTQANTPPQSALAGDAAVDASATVTELLREHDRLNRRVAELEKKAADATRKIEALLKALEAEGTRKK